MIVPYLCYSRKDRQTKPRDPVTNSIPPFRLKREVIDEKILQVDVAPLLAEAIRRMHSGGSLVELVED